MISIISESLEAAIFRSLIIFVFIFSAAQTKASDACSALLKELQPHLDSIAPVLGESLDGEEFLLPGELEELIQLEGGVLRFLGQGAYGKVYRWHTEDEESIVIKYYEHPSHGTGDDEALKALRRIAHKDDYIRVIQEVRPRTKHLRFYNDIHGITLKALRKSQSLAPNIFDRIQKEFEEYKSTLIKRLESWYELESMFTDSRSTFIKLKNGPLISIGLHEKNLIFESETGYLWIIDPF